MTDDEIIAVVQAHKEGKQIQTIPHFRSMIDVGNWQDCNPVWDFYQNDYRVKPEPRKPREWWVYVKGDILYGKQQFPDPNSECICVREVIE